MLVDIRPTEQRGRDGELPGAGVIDRNVLEWRLDTTSPNHVAEITDQNRRVILVCNEGYASSLAAATLRTLAPQPDSVGPNRRYPVTMNIPERLLTPGEVARMFRVDPKTVTRWAASGRIGSIRTPGGHRRFRESEVKDLLDDRSVGASPSTA
jgi:excisionase family DNA binding protein